MRVCNSIIVVYTIILYTVLPFGTTNSTLPAHTYRNAKQNQYTRTVYGNNSNMLHLAYRSTHVILLLTSALGSEGDRAAFFSSSFKTLCETPPPSANSPKLLICCSRLRTLPPLRASFPEILTPDANPALLPSVTGCAPLVVPTWADREDDRRCPVASGRSLGCVVVSSNARHAECRDRAPLDARVLTRDMLLIFRRLFWFTLAQALCAMLRWP